MRKENYRLDNRRDSKMITGDINERGSHTIKDVECDAYKGLKAATSAKKQSCAPRYCSKIKAAHKMELI